MSTVAGLLAEARALGVDRLDALLLLAHHLHKPRTWLLAHDGDTLAEDPAAACRQSLVQRAGGEPLAYLVGEREFHGLTLHVTPDVLIPRPDTETLVDWALEVLAGPLAALPTPEVLDMGTGSGAIALALKHRCPRARVTALDTSPAALGVACTNAERLGLRVEWLQSDWFSALGERRFDIVLANPPYINGNDSHLAALHHEPLAALSPGNDGLSAIAEIASSASRHLRGGGWLILEHGHDQGEAVALSLSSHGLGSVSWRHDLGGHRRCTAGQRIQRHGVN